MSVPADLKYTDTHEWVRLDKDDTVVVGITHHAQDLLGDLVFVENPQIGRRVRKGEECGVVESVKAASDIYAPISGEIVAANSDLDAAPQKINEGPYQAWIFKLRPSDPAELDKLLDAATYQKLIEAETH